MYTLIIEGTLKADKKEEFKTAWGNEILPTLKKQVGFVDEMLLFETKNPNRVWGLAFGRGKRTRNGITEKSFRSSSIRCSISLRPLRPCAPLFLRRPKPSAFLRAKPREPCVVAKGRTLSKRRDG